MPAEDEGMRSEIEALRIRVKEAEQALEAMRTGRVEREHFLAEAIENATTAFGVGAPDGSLVFFNRAFAELTGYSREELEQRRLTWATDLTPFEWRKPEAEILSNASRKGETARYQKEYLRKDGSRVPIELTVQPVLDSEGKVVHYRSFITDITERKRQEAALVNAHQRTTAILESIADAFYSLDDQWRFVVVNPAAERAPFGRPASELLGKVIWDIFPALPGTRIHKYFLDAVEHRIHEHYEAQSPLNHRWYEVFMFPRTGGLDVYLRDIDDRKRAEASLRDSGERYRHLFENLSEGFALHEMIFDPNDQPRDYRFLEINPTFERMTGLTKERVIGRTLLEVMPHSEQYWIEKYGQVVVTGKPLHFENHARELGRDYEVIAFRPSPGQFAALVVDISERKRLERLYAVLSQVNEVIVRTRDEQTLLHEVCRIVVEQGEFPLSWIGFTHGREVVPTAVFGPQADYVNEIRVEVEGALGQGPTGKCIRENRPVINEDFETNANTAPWRESALLRGFRASAAFPLRKGNQTIGAFTLYAGRPGAFDAAHVSLLEALCADLSYALVALEHERKRAESEEALREADRRKDDFLALLSHELRNPLAPIKNSLFILGRATPGSEQAKHALAVIDRQAGQLARLVDDLLDVTRITRDKIQLQTRSLELNELVRLAVEDQRSVFKNSEIYLEFQRSPDSILVNADWNRLTQVVGNLLQNAAKFTSRGGSTSVTVHLDGQANRAVIRVTDTGIGIAPLLLAQLFQPFMQADHTLDHSQGGLGLGLALVKGLVELHGGDVTAHSDGLGQGATFVVRLPLANVETAALQPSDSGPKNRRRILIIEDNIDAADTLREALEFCEHEVEVAYSGPDGIEKARQLHPNVVLCDIGLPGMDGYRVACALRADDSFKGLFLVALSGYALPDDLERADAAGFDRHLAKPPSLEKIQELLDSLPQAN